MNPDGIFTTNFGVQAINTTLSVEKELSNVKVYIEGCSDLGVDFGYGRDVLQAPAVHDSIQLAWRADFSAARPGITYLSFIVSADGYDYKRIVKKIFVSKVKCCFSQLNAVGLLCI